MGSKGVVSDHPLATLTGIRVLEKGGNAFDAAIAVSAVLSVVQPHTGGPGGDAFMLGFLGDRVVAYASSGRSPGGFDAEEFLKTKPTRGPLTVTVPGLVHLWGNLYEEYATMPLDALLEPAIKLAYSGFRVGWWLAQASSMFESELSAYKWCRYFTGLRLGGIYRNQEMARALRLIASRGCEEFYYGDLAERVVNELVDQGVNIGLDDLMGHESYEVKPLRLEVDSITLYELPPNTQGLSTLQLVSALYELELRRYEFKSPERVALWEKPTRDVYSFRDLYLGDPDYMTIDPHSYVKYSSLKSAPSPEERPRTQEGDTTFFVVSDGEAVIGFVQSLFHSFGSGLVAAGFPVQNRAIGFAKRKGLPNSPAPRKLPLHTLSVLGIDVGEAKYVVGCVGGDIRPQLHLRVFENIFVYGMHPAKAVNAPRFLYANLSEKPELIVEDPLRAPATGNYAVRQVGYLNSPGHVHVCLLKGGEVGLSCDVRSEGVAQAI